MVNPANVRTIDDGAALLCRIHPRQIIFDKNIGAKRPSSAAFKDPEMSVDVEPILSDNGLDWRFSLRNHPDYSLVRFLAGEATSKGLSVVHKPEKDNVAHAEVLGKKTSAIAKHLATVSVWVP
jgi:hypothetical protein